MKEKNIFIKCSCWTLILSAVTLVNEFIQLVPTHATKLEGILLVIGPSIFAIIGVLLAIAGTIKNKSRLGIFLIIINFILLFWPYIYWYGALYILGV